MFIESEAFLYDLQTKKICLPFLGPKETAGVQNSTNKAMIKYDGQTAGQAAGPFMDKTSNRV